jgi:hypothetical protein
MTMVMDNETIKSSLENTDLNGVKVWSLDVLIGIQNLLMQAPARVLQAASPLTGTMTTKGAGCNPMTIPILKGAIPLHTNHQEKGAALKEAPGVPQEKSQ